ncbi:MAG TPA: glycine oxidase ThiO [Vicinamibacterales bacterium]|nr:glycine oxidase ThiO [Vicinamibacterales bacterium]
MRDVLVIGGGVIGCAVAYELARRGCRVRLVADRALAQGATQASGGMLVPYVEAEGGPMLDLSVRSLGAYDQFVDCVRRDAEQEEIFEYARRGSLQVALRGDPAGRFVSPSPVVMQSAARELAALGARAEWLDEPDLRSLEPHIGEDALGALYVRDHGVVSAEGLTGALWAAASAHGATFTPGRVTRIHRSADGCGVEASGRELSADVVVLAAGAWSGRIDIEGSQHPPVFPVRGQLLRLRWPGPPLERILWGPRCYVIPWSDGRVLVGATVEHVGFDERNTTAGVRDLLEAMADLLPQGWQASFEEARAGLRPGTPDDRPIIGRARSMPGLVYATGHYRNGVLLAPVTAQLVADLVVDGREDDLLRLFSPDRFGGHDGHVERD